MSTLALYTLGQDYKYNKTSACIFCHIFLILHLKNNGCMHDLETEQK